MMIAMMLLMRSIDWGAQFVSNSQNESEPVLDTVFVLVLYLSQT